MGSEMRRGVHPPGITVRRFNKKGDTKSVCNRDGVEGVNRKSAWPRQDNICSIERATDDALDEGTIDRGVTRASLSVSASPPPASDTTEGPNSDWDPEESTGEDKVSLIGSDVGDFSKPESSSTASVVPYKHSRRVRSQMHSQAYPPPIPRENRAKGARALNEHETGGNGDEAHTVGGG